MIPTHREKLISGATLTDEDKLAIYDELAPLLAGEGWQTVKAVAKHLRQEALEENVHDEKKSRDYYRGKIDGIDAVGGHLSILEAEGESLYAAMDAKKAEGGKPNLASSAPGVLGVFRPGSGGF